jgi:hypothetical protein
MAKPKARWQTSKEARLKREQPGLTFIVTTVGVGRVLRAIGSLPPSAVGWTAVTPDHCVWTVTESTREPAGQEQRIRFEPTLISWLLICSLDMHYRIPCTIAIVDRTRMTWTCCIDFGWLLSLGSELNRILLLMWIMKRLGQRTLLNRICLPQRGCCCCNFASLCFRFLFAVASHCFQPN